MLIIDGGLNSIEYFWDGNYYLKYGHLGEDSFYYRYYKEHEDDVVDLEKRNRVQWVWPD